jgi:hypothetical protein
VRQHLLPVRRVLRLTTNARFSLHAVARPSPLP